MALCGSDAVGQSLVEDFPRCVVENAFAASQLHAPDAVFRQMV
jgi:hypothetical protein